MDDCTKEVTAFKVSPNGWKGSQGFEQRENHFRQEHAQRPRGMKVEELVLGKHSPIMRVVNHSGSEVRLRWPVLEPQPHDLLNSMTLGMQF